MAQNASPSKGHPAMDYAEHYRTYNGFIKGTIIIVLLIALLLICMAATLL
jgi:Bacterial aa3 type cytochrome c oxidase subunit IV